MSDKYEEDGFKQWLKDNNLSHDGMEGDELNKWQEEKYKEYEASKEKSNNSKEQSKTKTEDEKSQGSDPQPSAEKSENEPKKGNGLVRQEIVEKDNRIVHQEQQESSPEAEHWINKKRNSWQPWCEQEHNPAYIYDENEEFKTGLEFDVYKTQQDKDEGKKAASIRYEHEDDVTITTEKGKVPDYEFFAKLAKEAKSDNIPGITFEGEMTPDFKARLAVACLENGLNIENGPENIDVNLLGQDISDDLKKKIETYNKEKQLESKRKELEATHNAMKQKAEQRDKSQPVDISNIEDKNEKAMAFAVHKNAGIEVTGLEDSGLVHAPDLHLFPQEAKDTIVKNNESILKDTYDKMKKSAEQYNKTEPVDISNIKGKNEKAIAFAVYKNAGIEVTGLKSQQNPDGLLQTQDLPFMPEEVREVVKNHNYEVREQQVARLKTRRAELKADPNTSEEVKKAITEREKVEAAREAVRGKTKEEKDEFLNENEEHRKHLGKNRYKNKPNVALLNYLEEKTH